MDSSDSHNTRPPATITATAAAAVYRGSHDSGRVRVTITDSTPHAAHVASAVPTVSHLHEQPRPPPMHHASSQVPTHQAAPLPRQNVSTVATTAATLFGSPSATVLGMRSMSDSPQLSHSNSDRIMTSTPVVTVMATAGSPAAGREILVPHSRIHAHRSISAGEFAGSSNSYSSNSSSRASGGGGMAMGPPPTTRSPNSYTINPNAPPPYYPAFPPGNSLPPIALPAPDNMLPANLAHGRPIPTVPDGRQPRGPPIPSIHDAMLTHSTAYLPAHPSAPANPLPMHPPPHHPAQQQYHPTHATRLPIHPQQTPILPPQSPIRTRPSVAPATASADLSASTSMDRRYHLEVVQQPGRARMCGFGEKDRRPVDPPPIVKLLIFDQFGREDVEMCRSPFFVLHTTLRSADDARVALDVIQLDHPSIMEHPANNLAAVHPDTVVAGSSSMPRSNTTGIALRRAAGAGRAGVATRVMMGTLVSSPNVLKDTSDQLGCFFCFPDLSIRCEGTYRLRFTLVALHGVDAMYIDEGSGGRVVAEVDSQSFNVYSAKRFPGMTESTELSKTLANQGMKIPIRNDVRRRQVDQP